MRYIYSIKVLVVLFILCLTECKTDVDVIYPADYLPIVNCIYCPDDSVINVRVNRSFQGNQSAYLMALEPDSGFLKNLEVSLEFVNYSGFMLWRTELPLIKTSSKESGIFFTQPNLIFSKVIDYPYRSWTLEHSGLMRLVIYDSILNRYTVGESEVYGDPSIVAPKNPLGTFKISIYGEGGTYIKYLDFGCYYSLIIEFNYKEFTQSGDMDLKSINWSIPCGYNGGEVIPRGKAVISQALIDGDAFYRKIGQKIQQNELVTRDFESIKVTVYVCDPALKWYQDICNGEFDVDPQVMSNITNGLGIFACARKTFVDKLRLDQRSIDSLCEGSFTRNLSFRKW